MRAMRYEERIHADPQVCGGEPCVKGTRIPVAVVLSHLAAGESVTEVLDNFPTLTQADLQACLAYASFLATEKVLPL